MVHLAAIHSEYPPFVEIKGRLEGLLSPLSRWASENFELDLLNESRPSYSKRPSYSIAAGNNPWGRQCEEWERLRFKAFNARWNENGEELKAEALFAENVLRHQWEVSALAPPYRRAAYGTAISVHDRLGLHFEYSDKIWNADTLRYNKEVNLPLLQDLAREMQEIGINAFQTQSVMVQDYIFVPDAKVASVTGLQKNSYTVSDTQSHVLLLAYLLHKGFIEAGDPAIKATFPSRTRNLAAEVDMGALLAELDSEVDIAAVPRYEAWLALNPADIHLDMD